MIHHAFILLGGKGTRLAGVISDRPKPMADICGKPFLHYLLLHLKNNEIHEITFLVGYMHEFIFKYFGNNYLGITINYQKEETPRGTGGFIYEISKNTHQDILLINGDTFLDLNIQEFYSNFKKTNANISLASINIENSDRYGTLEVVDSKIVAFNEKKFEVKAQINAGVYLFNSTWFSSFNLPFQFSFEIDFLQKYCSDIAINTFLQDCFFIDIGIPEDYFLAQKEIPKYFLPTIDKTWTLFLDRDGVLNTHRPLDYVKSMEEFEWIDGSKIAAAKLSNLFGRTFIVTNQQGIGKGLMTTMELEKIHFHIQDDIKLLGGRIDEIYYCPHLAEYKSNCRKPKIGMALKAKMEYPEIDLKKSIMIGDMGSDMEFGRTIGSFNILVENKKIETPIDESLYDLKIENLAQLQIFYIKN